MSKENIEIPMIVTELSDDCLYSGFFGDIDGSRMIKITERILELLSISEATIVIIDLQNIGKIELVAAKHLEELSKTINTMGCGMIICGISPRTAQIMISSSVDVTNLEVRKNLRKCIDEFIIQPKMGMINGSS